MMKNIVKNALQEDTVVMMEVVIVHLNIHGQKIVLRREKN